MAACSSTKAFRGRKGLFGLCNDLDAGWTFHDLKTILVFQCFENAKSQLASICCAAEPFWQSDLRQVMADTGLCTD
jgi:hypothetical protein